MILKRNISFIFLVLINFLIGVSLLAITDAKNFFSVLILLLNFFGLTTAYNILLLSPKQKAIGCMLLMYWSYGIIMPAIYQVGMNIFPWEPRYVNHEIIFEASVLSALATIFFLFGYFSVDSKMSSHKQDIGCNNHANINNLATLFLFIAILTYCISVVMQIGILPFISTRGGALEQLLVNTDLAGLALKKALPGYLSITIFLIAAYNKFVLQIKSKYLNFIVFLSFILMMVMNFPLSIPRYMIVSLCIVVLLTVFSNFYTRFKLYFFILLPFLMYFVFPVLGVITRSSELNLSARIIHPEKVLLHGDMDAFVSIMNSIYLVQSEGLSLGSRMLSAVFFFIPRSIWHDKHQPTGLDAAEAAGYSFLNISMPLPGELFADFWYVGVVLGMFLFGKIIGYLDGRIEVTPKLKRKPWTALIGIATVAFIPILFRGSLLSVIAPLVISIIVISIWNFLCRLRV